MLRGEPGGTVPAMMRYPRSTLRLISVAWPFVLIVLLQTALATFSLQVSTSLRDLTRDYRNPAVHSGEFIDPQRARAVRELLLGEAGLLHQIETLRLR